MHLVFRFGKQCVRGVAERGNFQQANCREKSFDKERRTPPERRERPMFAGEIRMENAFVPTARPERIVRIFADHVEKRLEDTKGKRPRVLRHEQNVRTIAAANFVHKFRKALGVREIENSVRLGSVAIAAADHKLVPGFRELQHLAVFFPAANAAQLKGMNERTVFRREIADRAFMAYFAYAGKVPQRMIQDDQHFRNLMERGEKLAKPCRRGICRVFRELAHD
jgi:hypothetical protein